MRAFLFSTALCCALLNQVAAGTPHHGFEPGSNEDVEQGRAPYHQEIPINVPADRPSSYPTKICAEFMCPELKAMHLRTGHSSDWTVLEAAFRKLFALKGCNEEAFFKDGIACAFRTFRQHVHTNDSNEEFALRNLDNRVALVLGGPDGEHHDVGKLKTGPTDLRFYADSVGFNLFFVQPQWFTFHKLKMYLGTSIECATICTFDGVLLRDTGRLLFVERHPLQFSYVEYPGAAAKFEPPHSWPFASCDKHVRKKQHPSTQVEHALLGLCKKKRLQGLAVFIPKEVNEIEQVRLHDGRVYNVKKAESSNQKSRRLTSEEKKQIKAFVEKQAAEAQPVSAKKNMDEKPRKSPPLRDVSAEEKAAQKARHTEAAALEEMRVRALAEAAREESARAYREQVRREQEAVRQSVHDGTANNKRTTATRRRR